MVMKDKLHKNGRKHSPIFNQRNLVLFFTSLTLSTLVAIPTYITIAHIEAHAKEDTTTTVVETNSGDNSILGIDHILTYK